LDATGAGVGNVAIELRDAGGAHRQSLPPTDATGLVQGECEVAPFTAWVLPRRLQDQQALIDFHKAHAGEDDPLTAVRMRLGDVSPRLGETVEADLRLPSGWDQ
jgi:hypothetical protein